MNSDLKFDGERVLPEEIGNVEEYLCYLRHRAAYEYVCDKMPSGLEWLEIGSGEGYGTNLVSSGAKKITGLDVDKDAVAHASNKYSSAGCSYSAYDGKTLPVDSNSIDVVISFQVIEHVEDDNGFVAEARRVLKTGGRLILTTPNRIYRLRPGEKPWNRFHVREYYPEEFRTLLASHFSDVSLQVVKGKQEAQHIEVTAVKRGFHNLDRLNLRRLLPDGVRSKMARLARRVVSGDRNKSSRESFVERFSTSDYFVTGDELESGLDLIGFCRKD